MELKPHQSRAVAETHAAIAEGHRKIIITAPTGGGKSLIAGTLLKDYMAQSRPAILYTNKRLLTTQNAEVLAGMGLDFGMRAAGHETDLEMLLQVASVQTEHSRVHRAMSRDLHNASLVIVEEAHVQLGKTALDIFQKHHDSGAAIVGITATPLDMGDFYEKLIVAGTNSELRDCGMLVPAIHYGADEPDLKAMKVKDKEGADFSQTEQKKAIMTPTIFARVFDWFEKLNPEHKPTILFGPGVNESIWFAERFQERGINAAHIDGEDIWIKGEMMKSTPEVRKQLADGSKSGDIVVVCNRYVLREGVNWPWVQHGILAYVVGSLQTYLQIGGRFLRAYPGKGHCIIQDHGGAWWRHGSLNTDREWNLNYTNSMIAGIRADRMRKKIEKEPWRCRCGRIRTGTSCECGATVPPKRSRPVVMKDGSLREMTGDIYRPRRIMTQPNGQDLWTKMYWRSKTKKGERTFRAAMALFSYENNFAWPDPEWRFMPREEIDFYRLVSEVPMERLR